MPEYPALQGGVPYFPRIQKIQKFVFSGNQNLFKVDDRRV